MYQLSERDKNWVLEAVEKGFTRLQVKRKLQEVNYSTDKLDAFLDHYDVIIDREREVLESDRSKKDEELFKDNIKKYFNENRKELSFLERREIKRFIKGVERYIKLLKSANKEFLKEYEYIKNSGTRVKIEKEVEYLKKEIIDQIIESKSILDIEHPITGEDITKENLLSLNIDELIKLIEENIETLELVVNGKITE